MIEQFTDKEMTYLRACNAMFRDLESELVRDVMDCKEKNSSINRNKWLSKQFGKSQVSTFVVKYVDGAMKLLSGVGPFYISHTFYEFAIIDKTLRYSRDLNFGHYTVDLNERAMYPQIVDNIYVFDDTLKRSGPFSNPVMVCEGPLQLRYNLIARLVGIEVK